MITKAISLILENTDSLKDETTKSSIIDVLCTCVSKHENGPKSGREFYSWLVIKEF